MFENTPLLEKKKGCAKSAAFLYFCCTRFVFFIPAKPVYEICFQNKKPRFS